MHMFCVCPPTQLETVHVLPTYLGVIEAHIFISDSSLLALHLSVCKVMVTWQY